MFGEGRRIDQSHAILIDPRPPVLVRGRCRRYLLRHTALTIDTPPALSVLAVVLVAVIVGAGGTAILLPR